MYVCVCAPCATISKCEYKSQFIEGRKREGKVREMAARNVSI